MEQSILSCGRSVKNNVSGLKSYTWLKGLFVLYRHHHLASVSLKEQDSSMVLFVMSLPVHDISVLRRQRAAAAALYTWEERTVFGETPSTQTFHSAKSRRERNLFHNILSGTTILHTIGSIYTAHRLRLQAFLWDHICTSVWRIQIFGRTLNHRISHLSNMTNWETFTKSVRRQLRLNWKTSLSVI